MNALEKEINITAPISNCPFCGEKAALDWNIWNGVRVACTNKRCGIATDWFPIHTYVKPDPNRSVWDEDSPEIGNIDSTTTKLSALEAIMKWNRRV